MKCLSLFSGIGGFDLALQRHGHEIIGACENERNARQIYERHFPGTKIYEDARTIKPKELPDIDLLCAGFPCQPFSYAGKRLGFEDIRGTLFFEIARIAKEKRPEIIFLENVKGILNHDKGRTFGHIINTLDGLGYDVEWQVINSKNFIPQNRERIFIIGHLRGKPFKRVFPIREVCEIPVIHKKPTVVRCFTFGEKTNGLHSQMTLIGWSRSGRSWGIESRIKFNEANSLNTGDGCGNISTMNFVTDFKDVRKLTWLECERLQGFPDGWTEGISSTARYRCLGNAVTVPVIECIVSRMTLDRNCLT